jgi:hypothetical protein
MSHRIFLFCITLSILCSSIGAQQSPAAPDDLALKQEKALKLLKSLTGQVGTLHSAENRARIGSNIADLLWNHDGKQARDLFAATAADLGAGFNTGDLPESDRVQTLAVFSQLRRNIVERIARYDVNLALEYLHSTRPPADEKFFFDSRDVDRALELQLAVRIAAEDPRLASKVGHETLERCFCPDLLPLLAKLTKKDKSAAGNLFKAIADKLKRVDLAQQEMGLQLAVGLVRSFPDQTLDEQVYRDLLDTLLTSAVANGCGTAEDWSYACRNIGSVYSQLLKYDPSRVAGLERWANESTGLDVSWKAIQEVFNNGTVEEILALAPQYPDLQFYIQRAAVTKAATSGDTARARQLVAALPEEDQRRNLLAELDRLQMWTSMDADKLAAVQNTLSNFQSNQQRAQFLLVVASQVGANNRRTALRLADQASQIIEANLVGKDQLKGQISLALVYCSLKNDRGFAIMESVVPKLNELVAAAATLNRFENNYLRDGEWAMSAEGNLGAMLTDLAQNAGEFARLDFDRSVNLAGQFERPELRLMAQLKIAQSILTPASSPSVNRRTLELR